MKLAFPLPHAIRLKALTQPWETAVRGADQTRMAKRADELGYDMILVPEHFVIPEAHLELSGPHYFHSIAAQAYLAGATERIRIGASITVLPLHHPIVLAKALATADWMSSGRITAAFGVGWLEAEFEVMGVPFRERGRRSDEYLAAMLELWTQERPSFHGEYVSFSGIAFEPKPVQQPHLPVWLGGDADPALARVARFGSGWIPFLTPPEDFPARLDFIRSRPDFRGEPFEVMYGLSTARVGEGHVVVDAPGTAPGMGLQELVDRLGRLGELGVTMSSVPIPPVSGVDAFLDHAQWVIEEVRPRLA